MYGISVAGVRCRSLICKSLDSLSVERGSKGLYRFPKLRFACIHMDAYKSGAADAGLFSVDLAAVTPINLDPACSLELEYRSASSSMLLDVTTASNCLPAKGATFEIICKDLAASLMVPGGTSPCAKAIRSATVRSVWVASALALPAWTFANCASRNRAVSLFSWAILSLDAIRSMSQWCSLTFPVRTITNVAIPPAIRLQSNAILAASYSHAALCRARQRHF